MGFILASNAVDTATGLNLGNAYLHVTRVAVDKAARNVHIEFAIFASHQRRLDGQPPAIVDRNIDYGDADFDDVVTEGSEVGVRWTGAYALLQSNPITAPMLVGATVA